jgi:hypothetical protein
MLVVIQTPQGLFGRPVRQASALDPRLPAGPAAENSALTSAAQWGLPDFVFTPIQERKGTGVRELGDGLVVTGNRGAVIQVKSRESVSGDHERERRWLEKKAEAAARQASGTIRAMKSQARDFINGRGRKIRLDGAHIDWVGVVIVDHPAVPEGDIIPAVTSNGNPVVTLLRRDWEFLFDQLRSTTAVVDYLHRTKADSRPLGSEPGLYYALATADEDAAKAKPQASDNAVAGRSQSPPLLPKEPAASASAAASHRLYRIMLDDIAVSHSDSCDDEERLRILSWLDRLSVTARGQLGDLLMDALRQSAFPEPGHTRWQFRRVLQDNGKLQLCFGVCSQFSDIHNEAFRQWAILRHHETGYADGSEAGHELTTVAVLLTPRYDSVRLWDTSLFAVEGDLELDAEELTAMTRLWNKED